MMTRLRTALLAFLALWAVPAAAQAPSFDFEIGFCALTSVSAAVSITSSNCVFSNLTGVIANGILTASAVTGPINPGQPLVGSGVPTTTFISTDQTLMTGTGGAGTYRLADTYGAPIQTLGSRSMTTAGIPPFASYTLICATAQAVTWLGTGGTPTAVAGSGGQTIPASDCIGYTIPNPTKLQFIQQAATAIVGLTFYQ